jgi:RES domain-containing protein
VGDDVGAVAVRGVWLRHAPPAVAALERPDPPPSGRWQRGPAVAALYFAEQEAIVWAEWYRALAELGWPPERLLPRRLWSIATDLDRVADLSSERLLVAAGLHALEPRRAQWPAFQEVGERLASDGYQGVLYRSAARPEGLALCVFLTAATEGRLRVRGQAKLVDRPPVPPRGMHT